MKNKWKIFVPFAMVEFRSGVLLNLWKLCVLVIKALEEELDLICVARSDRSIEIPPQRLIKNTGWPKVLAANVRWSRGGLHWLRIHWLIVVRVEVTATWHRLRRLGVVRTRCDAQKRLGESPTCCGKSLQQHRQIPHFSIFHHPGDILDFGEHKNPGRSSPDRSCAPPHFKGSGRMSSAEGNMMVI